MNWLRHDYKSLLQNMAAGFLLAVCCTAALEAQVKLNYQNNETSPGRRPLICISGWMSSMRMPACWR